MIIYLDKSILFTKDPDIRFAIEYGIPLGNWKLLWQRHKLMEYSVREMQELLRINTGLKLSKKNIKRWIWRSEIYSMTLPLINKGTQCVVSDFFGEKEYKIIKELTKNLSSSVHKNTSTLP